MTYGDFVHIRDINGQIQVDERFEDYLECGYYVIIDTQEIAESIGGEILDENKNNIQDKNGEINHVIIYKEIDKRFSNDLINTIYGYIEEYLNNNL